jgi:RNA polymerase sigma-70 factor (ECF subfamily)
MSPVESEAELVAQAVAGDRFALERLLLAHATATARHIESRLPSAVRMFVDVDDLLQETFLHAFRSISRYEARAGCTFGGWLKTIADARLVDAVRREGRLKRGGGARRAHGEARQDSWNATREQWIAVTDARPSSAASRLEAISAVREAVATLPDDQRQAVEAHILAGRTLAETAAMMRRTEPAVRGLVYRAKDQLRTMLRSSSRWFAKRG